MISPVSDLIMDRQVLANRPPDTTHGPKFYVTVEVAAALLNIGSPVITVTPGASRCPLLNGTSMAFVLTAELKCLERFPPEVMPTLAISLPTCLVSAFLFYGALQDRRVLIRMARRPEVLPEVRNLWDRPMTPLLP